MKKILFAGIVFLSLFGGILTVKADTLYRTSAENNTVKLSLNTSQGFVGALELNVLIEGNVSVSSFTFDSSLAKEYIKKYTYDAKTKMLKLYMATGSATKNLASAKGDINLGTIALTSASEKESYLVKVSSLTLTNAKYQTEKPSTLINNSEDSFTYIKANGAENPEPPSSSNASPAPSEGTPSVGNTSQNENKASSSATDTEKKQDKEDTEKQEKKENDKSAAKTKEEKKEQKDQMTYIVLSVLAVFLIVLCVVYVRKNPNN